MVLLKLTPLGNEAPLIITRKTIGLADIPHAITDKDGRTCSFQIHSGSGQIVLQVDSDKDSDITLESMKETSTWKWDLTPMICCLKKDQRRVLLEDNEYVLQMGRARLQINRSGQRIVINGKDASDGGKYINTPFKGAAEGTKIDYFPTGVIGRGPFGNRVFKIFLPSGEPLAVKVSGGNKEALRLLQEEIKILKHLQHPNIVKLLHDQFHNEAPELFMELYDGDLSGLCSDQKTTFNHVKILIGEMFSVFTYLSFQRILHQDVKPENIFYKNVGTKITFALGNFAWARKQDKQIQIRTCDGSERYRAPEVVKGRTQGPEAEMFALGMILLEVFGLLQPKSKPSPSLEDLQSIAQKHVPQLLVMLVEEPGDRMSAEECQKWFFNSGNSGHKLIELLNLQPSQKSQNLAAVSSTKAPAAKPQPPTATANRQPPVPNANVKVQPHKPSQRGKQSGSGEAANRAEKSVSYNSTGYNRK